MIAATKGWGTRHATWLVSLALVLAVAVFDPAKVTSFIQTAGRALIGTAPYIMFAVALIATLKATGSQAIIGQLFVGKERRMIVLAAAFGGLAPFCSCEVIPFIAALLAMGVPLSAVMAFWLSSPLIDPPSLLITASALGWGFAIAKTLVAVALGLASGFTTAALTRTGLFADILRKQKTTSCCDQSCADSSLRWTFWREAARKTIFVKEAQVNALFLLKWLTFAYLLESLLIHYGPAQLIASLVGGPGLAPILTATLVGAPAYLNGYAAPPLVAGLMTQGMGSGAAMAFLVAGSVSSIPAMVAVWALVRPRVFATYLALGLVGAFLSGLIFHALGG
ncbi:MAG: permease [Pseudomonadota bacterium]